MPLYAPPFFVSELNLGNMRKIEAFTKTWMNQSMDRASASKLNH